MNNMTQEGHERIVREMQKEINLLRKKLTKATRGRDRYSTALDKISKSDVSKGVMMRALAKLALKKGERK